ncbi:MAG: ribosomal protein S18-alanine N-acetyltransferase [Pyrinomonadaceae bacterium]
MPHEPNSPRIRSVEASHIADLISIAHETNISHWSAQNYLDEMKNMDAVMLRLETDENTTIGFVVGRIVHGGMVETQLEGEIYNIAVTETEQKRGYGQLLFDAFKAVCSDRNAVNIWLEVRESNQPAKSFYQKNRFQIVQSRNNFYNNPREHAILMKLPLK